MSSMASVKSGIEECTSSANIDVNWQKIMNTCDEISAAPDNKMDEIMRLVRQRLGLQNPHIQQQAITLLSACVNNCGKRFHLAFCSRETEREMKRLLTGKTLNSKVADQLKEFLVSTEKEFSKDPSLDLVRGMIADMKKSGIDFPGSAGAAPAATVVSSSAAPSSQSDAALQAKEEEELARAIQESLKESQQGSSGTSSLYPSMDMGAVSSSAPAVRTQSAIPARVLYDFEATEDNELSLKEDAIIEILDATDENWWNGRDASGREGFFPASFVTRDLSQRAEPAQPVAVQPEPVPEPEPEPQPVELSGEAFDEMLAILAQVPAGTAPEGHPQFEATMRRCQQMKPLMQQALEAKNKQYEGIQALNDRWIEASASYETLMQHVHARRREREEKLRRQQELLQLRRAQEERERARQQQFLQQQAAQQAAQQQLAQQQQQAQYMQMMQQHHQAQLHHAPPPQPQPQPGYAAAPPQPGQAGPPAQPPYSQPGPGPMPGQGYAPQQPMPHPHGGQPAYSHAPPPGHHMQPPMGSPQPMAPPPQQHQMPSPGRPLSQPQPPMPVHSMPPMHQPYPGQVAPGAHPPPHQAYAPAPQHVYHQ